MISSFENKQQRIIKNTGYLYIRMFIMMIVSLFTSRLVLSILGESDFGIYNIVGGVVVLFSFLNGALNSATQRFLNYYLGRDNEEKANAVFCMSFNIYVILSLIIIVLAETIGLWFVHTQLNIPDDRMNAALWVYQFSILTFVINIIRVPYHASIICYEQMDFYAWFSIGEGILKLTVVLLLYISPFDKLVFYAFLYTLVPLVTNICYWIYCRSKIIICKFRFIWDRTLIKELFSFSTWSILGSIANLFTHQGVNILINIFYGVTVNATVGVANQVSNTVYHFITNVQTAFNPQIVKSYAADKREKLYVLIMNCSKYSFFLMWILTLPVILTIDTLLDIWLVDVPVYAGHFCQALLLCTLLDALMGPFWMAMQATGRIRNYMIVMSLLLFLNFPCSFLVLKLGLPPYYVWIARFFINLIILGTRLIYLVKYIDFSLKEYLSKVGWPIIKVVLVSIPIPILMYFTVLNPNTRFFLVLLSSIMVVGLSIYTMGLDVSERKELKKYILFIASNNQYK